MEVVILAGGMQSTLSNEREGIPKPMIEVGGKPLLWHIMKHFSDYGLKEFIVCGGYRIDQIKAYFMDFYIYQSDITVNLQDNTVEVHKRRTEDWNVTVMDTGLFSSTGQRVSMVQKYIKEDEFIVTYGDCLSDLDIDAMRRIHRNSHKAATVAMAKPTGRSQLLPMGGDGVLHYGQKDMEQNETAWINADCMILHKEAFSYLQGNYDLEKQLFVKLSEKRQLATYKHTGYWTAIETKRDLAAAESLWNAGMAPWIKKER